MKISAIATAILVVLFGSAAYMAAAVISIIYALGNNKAAKEKRTALGLLGVFMLYLFIDTFIYLVKNSRTLF